MSNAGSVLKNESPSCNGFLGIGKEAKGSLWKTFEESRSCDVCKKKEFRDVSIGLYTGVLEWPYPSLKRISVGYKGFSFDYCKTHSEREIRLSVKKFLRKHDRA